MTNLPIGTVIYSRNLNESFNKTPGCVNHLAIIVGDNQVVEAQEDLDGKSGVILSSIADFKSRHYQFGYLYPKDKQVGIKAAETAKTLVGKKYAKLTSIRPKLSNNIRSRKMNCVTVINVSYSKALGTDVKMAIPDDIFRYGQVFTDKLS